MTPDDWHYAHAVLNNLAWLAWKVTEGKANPEYIWEHDFLPFIKWLNEHNK